MNIETFEPLLIINKHALDDELVQHSDVTFRIAKEMTKAREFHAAAADELKKVEAEAFAAQKQLLDNGKPLSDTRAEMATRNDPFRMKAWTIVQHAKSNLDLWEKLYEAWIGKAHNIKTLVALYATGQFSVGLPSSAARAPYAERPAVTSRRTATR